MLTTKSNFWKWALPLIALSVALDQFVKAIVLNTPVFHARECLEPGATMRCGKIEMSSLLDWSMIWKDIAIGVIVAGAMVVWVPDVFWQALFLSSGHGGDVSLLQMIENALVGPLVAVVSFVCSVGNVPLAAALFNGGISFGGALAFIYGDLIVIPMLLVYRQYYGTRLAAILGAILYIAMAVTGFVVDLIFSVGGWAPDSSAVDVGSMEFFSLDYTFWLNLIFIGVGLGLWALSRQANAQSHCAHHH